MLHRPILLAVRTKRVGWILRGGILVFAFGLALLAFRGGVGVSDRDGVEYADFLTHTYYALGLFVLGGLDIGLPRGGPPILRSALWVAYFLAPLITTGALIEGTIRVLRPEWLARQGLRDHVVVVGLGPLGMLFLEALRERDPRVRVLVVDSDLKVKQEDIVRQRFGALCLGGDIRHQATLDELHLGRARAVAFLTSDDLLNLEVAWQVSQTSPDVRVVAHVADIAMRRLVATVTGKPAAHVEIFNSHQVAAEGLHEEHLKRLFEQTDPRDVVVLAGFGRFGQTILEYLQREARGELARAVVVDVAVERQARLFLAQVGGFDHCELKTIEGDLDDPGTWDAVDRATEGLEVHPVYVLGTDDEAVNLRTAIALRALRKEAPIFVRCDHRSAFTAELSNELNFEVLVTEGMLRRMLSDRMGAWINGKR